MSEVKLSAVPRTEFGKGAARRLRRAAQVPAVIYGHGTEPVHVSLPGHETMMALKQQNALLDLQIDGTSTLALPKSVQRDAVKGFIEHVDLILVRRGERVHVDVTVFVVGDAISGTLVNAAVGSLEVEAEANKIPQGIEVSVQGLDAGTVIHAGEVQLPEGATLVTDPETVVVSITSPGGETAAEGTEA